MNARILSIVVAAAAASAATTLSGGCTPNDATASTATTPASNPSTRPTSKPITPPSTQMTTLTGTLRGGMMAIGGETTGWSLVGDGSTGGVELDVARVRDNAKKLDGRRVTVSGMMIDKKYVERGTVRMMRVEQIEAAK
jgi:hypothetical protein